MKDRNWGISETRHKTSNGRRPDANIRKDTQSQAIRNYRENRENGEKIDTPNYNFPNDGIYSWETHNVSVKLSKIKYTEGPKDHAWMKEKDQNYLRRIARTGTVEEKAQLISKIQGGSYEQFFANEIRNSEEGQRKLAEEEKSSIEIEQRNEEVEVKVKETQKKWQGSVEMKERTWGLSTLECNGEVTYKTQFYLVGLERKPLTKKLTMEALQDYRKNRENGIDDDNPKYKFQNDGKYSWKTPNQEFSKVFYTEGPKDKDWMEEKDRNYLSRIARTGAPHEKAQLENAIQQLTSTDQSNKPKRISYAQFFENEIIKFGFKEEQRKFTEDEKARMEAERLERERLEEEARKKTEVERKKKEEAGSLERESLEEERIRKELEEAEKEVEILKQLEKLGNLKRERKTLKQRLSQSGEEKISSQSSQNNQIVQNTEEKELDQFYLIPYEKLEFGLKLGQGGFGAVFQGKWQHIPVAIKKLHLNQLSDHALQEFKAEASVMTKLHHLNVLTLYGVSIDNPGNYSMVIEYMPKGSLYNLLHNDNALSWSLRYRISMDICAGLVHLHEKNILHKDLKSMNVLLDENMRAKLSDFGLSKLRNETTATATLGTGSAVGTVSWMAPELFMRKGKYNKASDVYSLGMVFWEIAARLLPFQDALNSDQIIAWKKGGEHEDIPEECPNEYGDMIRECWKEQNARPSVEVLIRSLEKIFNPATASQSIHQSGPVYQFETKKNVNESGPVYQV